MARVYYATVRGLGEFPHDMLRYDACWPSQTEDVDAMITCHRDMEEVRRRCREPRDVTLVSHTPFTPERWQSFGWRVDRSWRSAS